MPEALIEKTYQEQYDEALAALDAQEGGGTPAVTENGNAPAAATTTAPETGDDTNADPAPAAGAASAPESKEDPATPPAAAAPAESDHDKLRKELESTQKALRDTQRWAHDVNAKLKRQDEDERLRHYEATKPQILRDNPGLEEAIRHVAPPREPEAQPGKPEQESFQGVMLKAHPDLMDIQKKDPELWGAMVAEFDKRPEANADPFEAIRAITDVKLDYAKQRAAAAQVAARATQAKQMQAMSVPGAGGAVQAPSGADPEDERARKFWAMSDEDFDKETNRVMGLTR